MMNTNNLSNIKLEDDFNEILNENRAFLRANTKLICTVHHINNNKIKQIEQEIKKCRIDNAEQDLKKLPDMLNYLVMLGVAKTTLDLNYSLTKLGERLRSELSDPYALAQK